MLEQPTNEAYIAALWEYPHLFLAFFGVQFQTKEGQHLFKESGIGEEMFSALEIATSKGLLLNRPLHLC